MKNRSLVHAPCWFSKHLYWSPIYLYGLIKGKEFEENSFQNAAQRETSRSLMYVKSKVPIAVSGTLLGNLAAKINSCFWLSWLPAFHSELEYFPIRTETLSMGWALLVVAFRVGSMGGCMRLFNVFGEILGFIFIGTLGNIQWTCCKFYLKFLAGMVRPLTFASVPFPFTQKE